jgi:acyl carrier protein
MEREDITRRLIEILTSKEFGSLQVDVSALNEDTSLINDIALDSLQLLELVVAVEHAFKFKANTKRLSLDIFDRFGLLVDFVEANVNTAAPAAVSGALHANQGA